MINTILTILAVVVGIIIGLKFIRSFVKGIIFLALLAIVIMVFMNTTHGTLLSSNTPAKIQASMQNDSSSIAQKLNGSQFQQIETNLQNTLTRGILSAKEAFSKSVKLN